MPPSGSSWSRTPTTCSATRSSASTTTSGRSRLRRRRLRADFGGFGDIFETFFGARRRAARRGPRSRRERGQDALLRVEVDLDEVIFGTKRDLEVDTAVLCETCNGSCCAPGTSPVTCDICHGTGSIQRTVRSRCSAT